jgi:hypothetical protein
VLLGPRQRRSPCNTHSYRCCYGRAISGNASPWKEDVLLRCRRRSDVVRRSPRAARFLPARAGGTRHWRTHSCDRLSFLSQHDVRWHGEHAGRRNSKGARHFGVAPRSPNDKVAKHCPDCRRRLNSNLSSLGRASVVEELNRLYSRCTHGSWLHGRGQPIGNG